MANGEQRRILIVEDERISAEMAANVLEKLGYTVAAILSTGEEAVAFAAEHKPDLVLMDISLPGKLDGIDAAARIYEADRTPVIFLTATIEGDTLRRVQASDGAGYIHKPVKLLDLKANIELVLKKSAGGKSETGKPRLVESDLVFALECDGEGNLLTISRSLARQLGLPDPKGPLNVDQTKELRAYPAQFESLASQAALARVDGFETSLVTALGEEMAVELSALSPQPGLIEVVVSLADARREAEDQAARLLDYLQAMLEDSRDPAWVLEPDGTVIFANEKAEFLFGVPEDDISGYTCFHLAHPEGQVPDDCPRNLTELGEAGMPCRFRIGKFKSRCILREVRDPFGTVIGFVGRIQMDKR